MDKSLTASNTKQKISPMNLALLGTSFVVMIISLYLIFMWVPTAQEEAGGIAQRIFYFHVPVAFVAFLAFFHVFVASILYLWKGDKKWDNLAYASAEIGVIFTTLVLISGPIWGKPTWGRWWVWDVRLTTTLMLWMIYVAYLLIRGYATENAQGARFSAVVGIIGFLDVPLVFMAIRWWRGQHPIVFGGDGGGLEGGMMLTFMVSLAAITILFFVLLRQRFSLKQQADEIEVLKERLDSQGD